MGIKFFNNGPVDTPLVEHATMTLAAHAGVTVAQTQLVPRVGVAQNGANQRDAHELFRRMAFIILL